MAWPSKLQKATNNSSTKSPRDTALDLLARRDHTALELRQKLLQRGFGDAEVASTLDELNAQKLIDATRFADLYARRRADKGYGPLKIRAELRERGLTDAEIDPILNELADFWPQKLTTMKARWEPHPDSASRLRHTRFLRQRGFTLAQINELFQSS